MAELHALAEGPLENLVAGVRNIVVDLKKQQKENNDIYAR